MLMRHGRFLAADKSARFAVSILSRPVFIPNSRTGIQPHDRVVRAMMRGGLRGFILLERLIVAVHGAEQDVELI